MLSESTHHGNCWPRTWQWDSWHVDSVEGRTTALKVYIPLSLGHRECECPGVGRISSQMRGSDWPIVMQWINHLVSTTLTPGSSTSKSFFFFFSYRRLGLLLVGTVKEIKSSPSLLPRYMGPLFGFILALFLHEALGCLTIPLPQFQRMKGRSSHLTRGADISVREGRECPAAWQTQHKAHPWILKTSSRRRYYPRVF